MRTLNDYFLTGKMTTISTAGSYFVTAPDGGQIIKIYTSIKNAITSADAGLSFEIAGTAVTDGRVALELYCDMVPRGVRPFHLFRDSTLLAVCSS